MARKTRNLPIILLVLTGIFFFTLSIFRFWQPYHYFQRGIARLAGGDIDGAIADYNQAITIRPTYAFAYCNRGIAYDAKGDLAKAVADCTKAIELDPTLADAYANRGRVNHENGNLAAAMADCNKAIELNPKLAQAYFFRGHVKSEQQDLAGALEDYDNAIRLKPDYAKAYSNRGYVEDRQGNSKQAMADFSKAVELNPNLAVAYCQRALTKFYNGDFDGAIADDTKAIDAKPDLINAYYDNSGKNKKFKDATSKVLQLQFSRAEYYVNRASTRQYKPNQPIMSDQLLAIQDYDHAIQLYPRYSDAFYGRALAEFHLGYFTSAIADYTKAIELNPTAESYYGRGMAKENNDPGDAVFDFNKALEMNPYYGYAYGNRGYCEILLDDPKAALTDCTKALELEPQYTASYYFRGCAYYNLDEFVNATADFQRYCDRNSDQNEDSYFRIYLARARQGDKEVATQELQAFLGHRSANLANDWGSKIGHYLTGELPEKDFLSILTANTSSNATQYCHAYYYAGSKKIIEGDANAAKDFFQKCLATNAKLSMQYHSAKAELKFLGTETIPAPPGKSAGQP